MSLVIDASVALKWVLPERDSGAAAVLLGRTLHAPNLILAECGNVLWAAARRRTLTADRARQCLAFLVSVPIVMASPDRLVESAMDIAFRLDHPIYDCLYLALALREGLPFVTADTRFAEAVRREGGPRSPSVHLLAEIDEWTGDASRS
ncbi:MAG: type II toxin-antitoxin system VapC family toxin [Alphaproteobacteria bacterium]